MRGIGAVPQTSKLTPFESQGKGCPQRAWHQVEQCWLPMVHENKNEHRNSQSGSISDHSWHEVSISQALVAQHVVAQKVGDQKSWQYDVSEPQHPLTTQRIQDGGHAQEHRHRFPGGAPGGHVNHYVFLEE